MQLLTLSAPYTSMIDRAAEIWLAGGLVAFPTETVYGLGADATNPLAVAKIFAAKGRPHFNPLIAHLPSLAAAMALGRFNPAALALAKAYWPGPMTLVVPINPDCPVCDLARAGLDTLALRVPSHPLAQALLHRLARPVVAPSANRSGHVSPTRAEHVSSDLAGRIDLLIDGGAASLGLESTIIACLAEGPMILRPGAITRAMVETVAGTLHNLPINADKAPIAPGQLASHYAPRARLRLSVSAVRPGEALLAFGSPSLRGEDQAEFRANLSPSGDLIEAAANLYRMLRELDATGVAAIAVAPIPGDGLGEAILDRLQRAAAPR